MEKKTVCASNYEYLVCLVDNDYYELIIPIPQPAPGFDAIHVLNDSEVEQLNNEGISSLTERMKDMSSNYKNYKLVSWR